MKNFQEFQEATRYSQVTGKSFKTGKPAVKGGTKKPVSQSKDAVLDAVKKSITDKYGQGAIMKVGGSRQPKKERAKKNPNEGGRILKMQDQKKKTAADAKEMGYGKDVKGYIETRARYGSKENMKSGKGLGT
tara:strand:- start:255 stop:650 length:396 start_codon:yes stop_codon:yes gene_type:complete